MSVAETLYSILLCRRDTNSAEIALQNSPKTSATTNFRQVNSAKQMCSDVGSTAQRQSSELIPKAVKSDGSVSDYAVGSYHSSKAYVLVFFVMAERKNGCMYCYQYFHATAKCAKDGPEILLNLQNYLYMQKTNYF
jgi:hypothetical protein